MSAIGVPAQQTPDFKVVRTVFDHHADFAIRVNLCGAFLV
jgi:hypothetical protein